MTVLVVEDEENDFKLASRILTHEGHRILGARSAEEAIDLLARAKELPEVILTDLLLPWMDGLAFTRRMKADPKTAAIPVAAMTSHLAEYSSEAVNSAGFSLILPKPLSGRTLPQLLGALIL